MIWFILSAFALWGVVLVLEKLVLKWYGFPMYMLSIFLTIFFAVKGIESVI